LEQTFIPRKWERRLRRESHAISINRDLDQIRNELARMLDAVEKYTELLRNDKLAVSEEARGSAETDQTHVQQRIWDRRHAVEEANAKVRSWTENQRASFDTKVCEQKRDRLFLDLNERADSAEEYAGATFQLAIAAADEAAQAALEALLARDDATRAALPSDRVTL
jgi:hypothetical protein